MIKYCALGLLILLSACATKHEFGPAALAKTDQVKLEKQFVAGVTRLSDVEDAFGACPSKRFNGEELQTAKAALAEGRNMSCIYRYLKGDVPDCDGTNCTLESGMDEYQEATAVFTFDDSGWLQDVKYSRRNHKFD